MDQPTGLGTGFEATRPGSGRTADGVPRSWILLGEKNSPDRGVNTTTRPSWQDWGS